MVDRLKGHRTRLGLRRAGIALLSGSLWLGGFLLTRDFHARDLEKVPARSSAGASPHLAPRNSRSAVGASPSHEPILSGGSREEIEQLARLGIPLASRSARPESLRGRELDGSLEIDEEGRFRPDASALRLFDYFLLGSGEEPWEVIRGRIVVEILARLPEGAQAEAIAVLDRYLRLQQKARTLGTGEDPVHAFEKLRALRRHELGRELAEKLYGEEEAATSFALDRRSVIQNESLSEGERERRMQELERRLPQSLLEARRRAAAPEQLRVAVERLRANGASADEVFALRERGFGRAEAERLAVLDAEREEWSQRWDAYRAERDVLLKDASIPPEQLALRLENLRRAHFRDDQLARAESMDESDALTHPTAKPR